MAIELVETASGTVYYVCDPSVLGDALPQKSNDPSDKAQPDNIFLTQDEGNIRQSNVYMLYMVVESIRISLSLWLNLV